MNIKSNQLNKLLREIGLFNSSNAFYSNKERKFSQVVAYTEQLLCVLDKLTRKRAVTLLDAGCGRAYVFNRRELKDEYYDFKR